MGTGSVQLCSDLINYPITLTDVLYIPHCPVNLLSVNAIALSHDCKVTFDRTSCIATRGTSLIWPFPASSDGVYKFACKSCTASDLHNISGSFPAFALDVDASGGVVIPTTLEWLWHRRLGHPGLSTMKTLVSEKLLGTYPLRLIILRNWLGSLVMPATRLRLSAFPSLRPVLLKPMLPCIAFTWTLWDPFQLRVFVGSFIS